MKVRKLNEFGCNEFSRYILRLRNGSTENFPTYMLTHSDTSEEIPDDITLESHDMDSRYEMGDYLSKVLTTVDSQKYIGDVGFWSWLALFWFDQLCPLRRDKVSMPYNYVLSRDYRHRNRHSVYTSWQLVSRYGVDARYLLCNKEMSVRGELMEQLMGRQDMLSMEGVMKLASKLYTDSSTGHFKKGVTSRTKGGTVGRYISFLQQLELTYDLFTLDHLQLASLLPKEFERFGSKEVG